MIWSVVIHVADPLLYSSYYVLCGLLGLLVSSNLILVRYLTCNRRKSGSVFVNQSSESKLNLLLARKLLAELLDGLNKYV